MFDRIDPPVLPPHPGAIAARLSIDEVAELADLLGLTPPRSVAVAVPAVDGTGTSNGDAVAHAARGGLLARAVLEIGRDDGLRVDDDAVAILATICRPTVVITVTSDRGRLSHRRTIYASPGGGIVETSRQIGGLAVMDYMSMPIESILPSIRQWTGLERQPAPSADSGAEPFTVLAGDAASAGDAVAAGHPDAATALLRSSAGVPGSGPAAYVRALAGHLRSNAVTILHRSQGKLSVGKLSVRRTAWNDFGPAGLWLVEQYDGQEPGEQDSAGLADEPADPDAQLRTPVTFTPISADGVVDRLITALPEPITSSTHPGRGRTADE